MTKCISTFLFFLIITTFSASTLAAQSVKSEYLKYLDSADRVFEEFPKRAIQYLDSIPEPVEESIKGHVAEYYQLKGFISDRSNNTAEVFQNFLMALKYAKTENNYDIAGMASIELFYNSYFIKKDSTAFNYLNDAETYYKKANNSNGLAEAQQMYAYVELFKKNYGKSNTLILQYLPEYQAIKDDSYYYMYALFMLSSNYIHQGDASNSHKYFNRLKALKSDTTISKRLHDVHKVSINTCIAEHHFDKKTMDSTLYYLKKAGELRYAMNNSDIKLYFKLYADYYNHYNDLEGKARYLDSLSHFQNNLLEKNITASLKINESLEKSEDLLEAETNKKHFNRNLIIVLSILIFILCFVVIIRYKTIKQKIKEFTKRDNEFTFLKTNHEKLKVKVRGLEDYISEVKKEVKTISLIDSEIEQRFRIKELYKNIHHNSSTLLKKGESHLDLINELNVDFFSQIEEKHPQLNHSEIIVCYYIFIGFKNKEIATFLNTSYRAVESKRYRIRKKLNFVKEEAQLLEYLYENFK
ncbi:helix-turn-helix transcriptional regulator [Lacinutrix chionoecetis]